MDLEHLTKHQIILLTLLVSFVTSIATGIVTVSLMSWAPTSVTKTINQIVEKTVQTVVPSGLSAAVATEKTVVVKDDDLAAQSIAGVQKSIIRITAKGGDELVARGILIDAKGTALTDRASLVASGAEAFEAILANGMRVPLTIVDTKGTTTPLAVLSVAVGTSTGIGAAAIGDASKLKLGQSIIRIGGKGVDTVATGVLATLPATSGDNAGLIEASVPSATPGSILITIFGEVVGMATSDSLAQGADFYATLPIPVAVSATKSSSKK